MQLSAALVRPLVGLAFRLGTGGAIIHYCAGEEEGGRKHVSVKGALGSVTLGSQWV